MFEVSLYSETMLEVMVVGGAAGALALLMVFEKWSCDRKRREESEDEECRG